MENRSWKILLIEDDEDDYIISRTMLAEAGCLDCSLEWMRTAEEGLAALDAKEWDVILVDYDLGSTNGLNFIDQAVSRGCQIPLILLTGRGSYQVDVEAMQRGATDFLSKKEVTPALLERAIRYAIANKTIEAALRQSQSALERRVRDRTRKLHLANRSLREEINERLRMEEQIRQQNRRITLLADLSRDLAEAGRDLQQVLNIILQSLVEHIGDVGAIMLVSDNSGKIETTTYSHHDIEGIEAIVEAMLKMSRLHEKVIEQAVQTGEILWVPETMPESMILNNYSEYQPDLSHLGVHRLLISPMKVQGNVIGTLGVARTQPGDAYTPEDQIFMEDLAGRAALAILNARLFEALESELFERMRIEKELAEVQRRLIDSVEAERLQVAQELHDVSMQELYGMIYQLPDLHSSLVNGDSEGAITYLRDGMQGVIQSLRTIAGELRPPALAPYGLEKAIRSHSQDFQEVHPDLRVRINLMPDGQQLSEPVRLALFRIYQTAMTNILRHAQATELDIRLSLDDRDVTLEIEDNGVGFHVPGRLIELARQGHLGLVSATERAEAVGGKLKVFSEPGQGTKLRVTVPLNQG